MLLPSIPSLFNLKRPLRWQLERLDRQGLDFKEETRLQSQQLR
jgi:hypothetical protein